MFTRRDVLIATTGVLAGAALFAFAQSASKPFMQSTVFNWDDLKVDATKSGERRQVFDTPTATLARFECHITTLNSGEAPHAGHQHPEEELMILREGTLEAVLEGRTNRVEAGGMVFCASGEMHGLRNIGTDRATYYVLKWFPNDLTKTPAK